MKISKTRLEALIREVVSSGFIDEGTPKTPQGPFKIGQFKRFKTLPERLQYLRTRDDVQEISAGSSRIAFFINNKKQVMKVAKWQRGKAQNRTEHQATFCGDPKYLPKMHAKASDFSWIIVDAVNPLKSGREFEKLTGYPLRAIEIGINFRGAEMQRRPDSDRTKKKWAKIYGIMEKDPWYRGLINMAINCDLVAGDIGKWDSWGVTKRGRIVLVDYGLTEEVWNTYYARSN